MQEEVRILKAMTVQDYYHQYNNVLSEIIDLETEHKSMLKAVERYFGKFPDQEKVTIPELQSFYETNCPDLPKGEMLDVLLQQVHSCEIENPEVLKDYIDHRIEKYIMGKINFKAMQLLDGDSGGSVIDEVTEYIQEYEELTQRLNEEEDHDIPLWVWLERQKKEGLTWSIEGLTELTGPLGPGTLAHVFARTHAGKTGFAISQIAHWALELRRRESKDVILFCSNEEPVPRIKQRIIKVNHTVDDKWIETHKEETEYLWNQYLKPWIILRHGVNDLFEIIRLIRRHKPIMVVIDQGPKVRIKGDYPQHQKLQILYQNYRQLAVRYNTRIMTLGQASADADDRKFIGIKMIDNAKTGLPGELDLAIGIGQLLSDSSRVNMRWLNVCKNKLTFNLGVKTCWVDPKNGKYK